MLANRYDRAAEAPIINTYVPINFGELYRIGAALKLAVDEAAQLLNTLLLKFGEFRSPSAVDTKKWYDSTINRKDMQEVLANMVSNPDWLKDASNRASIYGILNNIDYSTLSQLKQSREGMLARQKANLELMLRGGYNPLLHDVDFANYDTLRTGIFNDVSPLAYMSVVDMVKPYVDNLKGKYLGKKNGLMYKGVTDEDTDAQLIQNWSSIENSPYYALNLELIKKQTGVDNATAIQLLNNKILTAGREFTWNDVQRDPLDVANARHSGSGDKLPYGLLNLTDQLEIAYDDKVDKVFAGKNRQEVIDTLKDRFYSSKNANQSISKAIDDVVEYLSISIGKEANEVLAAANTLTGQTTKDGWRVGNSSSDFMPKKKFVYNITDINSIVLEKATSKKLDNTFEDDFERGQFKNFLVAGTPSITIDTDNIYHNKFVFIPESDINTIIDDNGKAHSRYSAAELAAMQASWVTLKPDLVKMTTSTDQYGDTKTSEGVTFKAGKYLRVPVMTYVPTEGLPAVENDAAHAKARNIGQDLRDQMLHVSEIRRLYSILKNDKKK